MIRIELTPSEATALVAELMRPRGGMWHPSHAAAVEKARDTLAGALEAWAHAGAPGVLALKAPAAPAAAPKKGPGRPRKEEKPAPPGAAHAHVYEFGRCKSCGEPEPQDCAHGYHLNNNGACSRCGKPEGGAAK